MANQEQKIAEEEVSIDLSSINNSNEETNEKLEEVKENTTILENILDELRKMNKILTKIYR